MNAYGGSVGITKLIIKGNRARDGREWSASRLGRFYHRGKSIRYMLNTKRDAPHAGLDILKIKNACSPPGIETWFLGRCARIAQSLYQLRWFYSYNNNNKLSVVTVVVARQQ